MQVTINNDNSNPAKVSITGSLAYQSLQLNITTSPITISLPFTPKSFMFTNDGSDFITAYLLNNKVPTLYAYNSSQITYGGSGTWSSFNVSGVGNTEDNTTTGGTAIFNPGVQTYAIGFKLATGTGSGIANIQISSDGGVTWANPSSVSGVSLNGQVGSQIDTIDTYSTNTVGVSYIYSFPTQGAWQIKLTVSGNKNPLSGGVGIYVLGAIEGGVNGLIIMPGESKTYPIQSPTATLLANSSSQSVRVEVIG